MLAGLRLGMRRAGVGAGLVGSLLLALTVAGCAGDEDVEATETPQAAAATADTTVDTTVDTTADTTATPSAGSPTAEATSTPTGGQGVPPAPFAVTSPAWEPGGEIPVMFTCDAEDLSPPLEFTRFDAGTQSLAIVMDDPDVSGEPFLHWLAWNVEPGMIPEGALPAGAVEGSNDFGEVGYGGPCPPERHEYVITVYELNTMLDLPSGATLEEFRAAIEGHVLGEASYRGVYG
ncbi:MAG: YbhB/YbcL family Raf kinase inhibitor-like protein [Dehalococcoidia bacterium]